MDIKETPDHAFYDIHIERRRALWIAGLVLVGTIILVVLTVDKVREFAERVVTPIEYRPQPLMYKIKGYPAASERAFDEFLSEGTNRETFAKLENFLQKNKVDKVVPPMALLRQGSDWQKIDQPPFAIPPENQWPAMVNTLKVLQQEVIPKIGDVYVLSGWRTHEYNAQAGGSRRSKHMHFCGLDMVPIADFKRKDLVPILRGIHQRAGRRWNMGLGIYRGIRFHVDTCGFRSW